MINMQVVSRQTLQKFDSFGAQEQRVTCSRKRTMQKRVVGSYETSLHITLRALIPNFWALTPSYGLQIAFS